MQHLRTDTNINPLSVLKRGACMKAHAACQHAPVLYYLQDTLPKLQRCQAVALMCHSGAPAPDQGARTWKRLLWSSSTFRVTLSPASACTACLMLTSSNTTGSFANGTSSRTASASHAVHRYEVA